MTYTFADAQQELEDERILQELAAQEEASLLNPEVAGKQGPAFVPGEREVAEAELEQTSQEEEGSGRFGPIITDTEEIERRQQAALGMAVSVYQGLGDTAIGLLEMAEQSPVLNPVSLMPGHKGLIKEHVKPFWHEMNPESDNPINKTIRLLSGVVIPSMIAPHAITSRIAALPWAKALPPAVRTTGAILSRIGIDTTIVAASSSADEENAAKALNDAFGWNIPWATREGAGPDERRWYNLAENAGFAGFAELISGTFALRTYLKNRPKKNMFEASWIHKYDIKKDQLLTEGAKPGTQIEWDPGLVVTPKTEEAVEQLTRSADNIAQQAKHPELQAIDDQINSLGPLDELGEASEQRLAELLEMRQRVEVDLMPVDDPLTRNIDEATKARTNSLVDEAAERAKTNQGEYDPILHDPAEAQQRARSISQTADVPGAMVDHHRMIKDINTTNGRARAVLPTKGMRALVKAGGSKERTEVLEEVVAAMAPSKNVEWLIEGKWKATPDDLKAAVDAKVAEIYNMDTKALAAKMNKIKDKVTLGQKFLSDEDFIEYSQAFRTVFDNMYDPQKIRASALVTQQAADGVSDAARAANVLEETLDVTRQQENMLENLAVVAKETRANRYLWGYQGRLLDMAKDKSPRVTEKLRELIEGFEEGLQASNAKSTEFIDTLKQINMENPEYLSAFTKAYDITDGKVDDMLKLHRWAEKNLSLTKLIAQGDPSVPSLIVQGIHGIRYNSLLNGLAPVRAFTGNTILTVGKPISAFAGSAFSGTRQADFKRALYTYGGFVENLQRALKHMGKEWDYVIKNPEQAMLRGRADVKYAQSDNFEVLESMAEAWRLEGGPRNAIKIGMLNTAKVMSWYNNAAITRWGVNSLHAIDGFTNSMMASGFARSNAYDELLKSTKGVIDPGDFDKLQKQLYANSFDETGLLTNTAAKHASSEVALNLDNDVVKRLEGMIDLVPALKPLFMFPRTGLNGLEVAWSFNPASALGLSIGRARKAFEAVTPQQIEVVLREHGITEFSMEAFQALKNEYRGRQVMGGAIVMGAGFMALNGNLTGNGSFKADERKDMMRLGWKPNSIRLNGKWYSYRGLEPYQQILSLVADTVYNAERVDSAITEDWFRKASFAISMNVTNQTFLSGLRPLVGIISGDETQIKRFAAGWTDPLVPFYWSGTRSILNKAITPQLKDVENEISEYHKNFSKFLFNENDVLKDQLDIYTGDPINYADPMTAAINAILPFGKSNGGHEPWRKWLLGTGWNNLQTLRTNRLTGQVLSPSERYWINNWVARHAGLQQQVEALMEQDKAGKFMHKYKNARGQRKQKEYPVSETYIHDQLDKIHSNAFRLAWKALEIENSNYADMSLLEKYKKKQLQQGDTQGATQTQGRLDQLLKLN